MPEELQWLLGNPLTAGIWSVFGVAVITLIKVWPVLTLQKQAAREKLRAEGRSDLSDCQRRMDQMATRMDGLYDTLNNLKIELSGVLAAYRVLEAAEEYRDPQSLSLAQARAILTTAFTVAPSTGNARKSSTLRSAEETYHAAEETVERAKRDEGK